MNEDSKDGEPKEAHEPWMNDPPCPRCGVTHKRTRVGKSMTFVIEYPAGQKSCGYTGAIPWKHSR